MAYIGKIPTAAALTASDITDGIITNAKLAQDIISGDTALGAEPADTDELLVSDAGVLKRMDYSYIKGGGKVLQVANDFFATSFLVTSTTETVIWTGSNLTLADTSSKVLIMGDFSIGGSFGGSMRLEYSTNDGVAWNDVTTADMGTTDAQQDGKALIGIHHSFLDIYGANYTALQTGFNYMHSPSSTSAKYRLSIATTDTSYTVSINRRINNDDYGGISFVTQMEVGA